MAYMTAELLHSRAAMAAAAAAAAAAATDARDVTCTSAVALPVSTAVQQGFCVSMCIGRDLQELCHLLLGKGEDAVCLHQL
jgi:hypothetical protein